MTPLFDGLPIYNNFQLPWFLQAVFSILQMDQAARNVKGAERVGEEILVLSQGDQTASESVGNHKGQHD